MKLIVLALLFGVTGCGPVLSKHALHEGVEPEPIDERLLGRNRLALFDMKFERGAEPGHYRVTAKVPSDEDQARQGMVFEGVVARLGDRRFLDLKLVDGELPSDKEPNAQQAALLGLVSEHHLIFELIFEKDEPHLKAALLADRFNGALHDDPPEASRLVTLPTKKADGEPFNVRVLEMKPAKLRAYVKGHPELFSVSLKDGEIDMGDVSLKVKPATLPAD